MHRTVCFSLGASALFISAAAVAQEDAGRYELDRLIEGRVAGQPVECVPSFSNSRITIISRTALVFESAGVVYVNVPENHGQLKDRDAVQTRTFGTRLCRTDIVTTFEPITGAYTGNISLQEFVPYRRAD
ncbi:MAG: hypothetical protein R3E02_06190 [Blastomonas sp.]